MNNELFDALIKEELSKASVTPTPVPSPGLKKSLSKKIFFQNLFVFHKFKIAAVLLLVAAIGYLGSYQFIDEEDESLYEMATLHMVASVNDNIANHKEVLEHSSHQNDQRIKKSLSKYGSTELPLNQSTKNDKNILQNTPVSDTTNKSTGQSPSSNNTNSHSYQPLANSAYDHKDEYYNTDKSSDNPNVVSDSNMANSSSIAQNNDFTKQGLDLEKADKRSTKLLADLSTTAGIVNVELPSWNTLKKSKMKYKEWSFDGYFSTLAKGDVDNGIYDLTYFEDYYFFIHEEQYIKTDHGVGLGANYSTGTKHHRAKFSAGLNTFAIYDSKPAYEYNEMTHQGWLKYFGVRELSWVNVYGDQGTCLGCFEVQNSDELQKELKKSHNKYTYIALPLTIGYEFQNKYFSIDLNGGAQTNLLTGANGVYAKTIESDGESFVRWDDKEINAMSRNSQMLKPYYFSIMASVNVRVRVAPKFDVFGGYAFTHSLNTISKDSYFIAKTYQSENFKFGITYYPKRTSSRIKPIDRFEEN